ncbi:MAG: hypothetical protein KatS3mg051_1595 [Anaerolineae bacterium]|nr:MAG: hypothetical protein KatS3mg051_1595 [Anaerolineae bacterium]
MLEIILIIWAATITAAVTSRLLEAWRTWRAHRRLLRLTRKILDELDQTRRGGYTPPTRP